MTNQKEGIKNLIVVLGMHRSGTSAITYGLSVLGVELGDKLIPEAKNNNDKGFWEDIDINKLNIDILSALGHDWHTLSPITNTELTGPIAASFKLRAVELLRKKLEGKIYFGIKDPRICRLLPFWQSIFDHLELNISYIIATRNPMSVARSLNKRDGFDFEKSYYLWIDHMLKSIIQTKNKNRIIVDYDLLIENPEIQLKRIAEQLNLEKNILDKSLYEYKNNFIENSLQHSKYEEKDLTLEKSAPNMAISIYKILLKSAKDEIKIDDLEPMSFIEETNETYKNHSPALNYIQFIDNKLILAKEIILNLEKKSAEHQIQSEQYQAEIVQKNAMAEQFQAEIAQKNAMAEQFQAEIAQKNAMAEQFQAEIAQKNAMAEQFQAEIAQKNAMAEQFQAEIAQKNMIAQQNQIEKDILIVKLHHDLNALRNSTSWKMSSPIRVMGRIKILEKIKLISKSIQLAGGFFPSIKKTAAIYKNEGLSGIKARVFIAQHHLEYDKKTLTNNHNEEKTTTTHTIEKVKSISWLEETRKINIDKYNIISFDVFDTAIIRLFESPVDIFSYIEKNKNVDNFKQKRIEAETKARKKYHHKKDITLYDIYENLDTDYKLELETEILLSSANPAIYDLYNRAKAANKKIYFVSDMYLTDRHVASILLSNGYTEYDKLYVSSMDNLPKGDGSRFVDLKKEVGNQKILHIGDNALADYEWPKKLGIDSVKYHSPEEFFRNDLLVAPLYESIKNNDSISLSFLLGLYRKWKYGDKSTGWSLWRDVGFFFGGPLIYSFAEHISNTLSNQKNSSDLYFLARDGMIIKAVYDDAFKKPEQKTSYLLASRRALTFPLFSMDKQQCRKLEQLELYSVTHEVSTAEEVFERLAYPELEQILTDLNNATDNNSMLTKKSIKKILEKNHIALNSKAKKELAGVVKYLDQEEFFNKDATVIDVGWSGTIQDCLNKILDISGINKGININGIYIGVTPHAADSNNKNGFIFNKDNLNSYKELSPFLDFIELLTSAPNKGLIKFTENHPFVVFSEPSIQENCRFEIAKEIQHGILDYTKSVKNTNGADIPKFSSNDFITIFKALQNDANPQLISLFDSVKHSRMPSESYIHSIINFEKNNV